MHSKHSHKHLVVFTIAVLLLGAACSGTTGGTASPTTAAPTTSAAASEGPSTGASGGTTPLTIGFIPENIQDPGFRSIQRAMTREGQKYGDTIQPGDAENKVEQQVTVIENLVSAGVDCLVIRARNQDTLAPATKAAKDKGIPVVGIFDTFPGADVVIGFNQIELGTGSGRLGGQYLNENFGGKGDVIVLNADSLGGTTIDRAKGIIAGLKETAPEANVVANVEAYTIDKALEVVSSALQANPNVRLVIGINDSSARGALAALKNAGKNVPVDAGVVAIAGEGVIETLNLIKSGEIFGTTSAALLEIGIQSVPTCHKLVAGEPVEARTDISPLKEITKENVDDQIKYVEELNLVQVQ